MIDEAAVYIVDETVEGVRELLQDQTGRSGIPPANLTVMNAAAGDKKIELKFACPPETVIEGQVVQTTGGIIVVRKQGSAPEGLEDGDVVVQCGPLDHEKEPFEDKGLENDKEYFYRFFPYSDHGVVNMNEKNIISQTPKAYILYSFWIDPKNSDPATRVHYADMAVGMEPAKMDYTTNTFKPGSWTEDVFFRKNNKPYMVKSDGTLDYMLNENDYTKKADGSGASAVSDTGYDGNAMARFDTVWLYQYTDEDGKFWCKICNIKLDSNYHAYAHERADGSVMDYILLSMFPGSLTASKVRSLKDQPLMNTQTGTNELTYAKANGALWSTRSWAHRNLINMLAVLMGRSTDLETVFGKGHTDGGSAAGNLLKTGTLYDKGAFYGTNTNAAMKIFHLENWWGDQWERIEGCVTDGTKQILVKMTPPYNTTGAGYTATGIVPGGTSGGYINESVMKEYGGYLPKTASGSASTYECDGLWFVASCYAVVGGNCHNGAFCGLFALNLGYAVSYSNWGVGAALSCEQPSAA